MWGEYENASKGETLLRDFEDASRELREAQAKFDNCLRALSSHQKEMDAKIHGLETENEVLRESIREKEKAARKEAESREDLIRALDYNSKRAKILDGFELEIMKFREPERFQEIFQSRPREIEGPTPGGSRDTEDHAPNEERAESPETQSAAAPAARRRGSPRSSRSESPEPAKPLAVATRRTTRRKEN